MGPTTLLLIDDHPLFRRGLAEYFNSTGEFQVVGEASSGRQGIALAEQLRPGLILIDLHMPGLGGLHVLDELGQLEIESRKVVLTASLDRKELLSALRLGADGYMLKETEPDDLRLYIRNCVQGVIVLDDCLVTLLAKDDDVLEGERGARRVELTEREAQTLALISEGMSNKQIARQLGISDGTVKVYVKNLLRKLNLRSRLELAAWVHRDALTRQ
ncbi:Nitrate/nitrite response regulator protein NarL [Paraburkholderia nemoris]|jgi:Response regulator containing a CheY-like receiver domain and an HTH DNA-binding domain|uniref:response regulator n=1 Tax=Paraburkholderia nemoris TaxID=2793076 RepID=UPI001909676E|nr:MULTISPECIES: response regulator [Paraburkholderia]MBK3743264.1 response regulator [Paraburkholderia aspalathi]MBK3783718.1 response regulator [Paraburkholderia aspalathi]CAE6731125.1 Nitrate/nitrite response regulator protein NarL [Paraburkholderia nemoris]CAE6744352.1 Nitrate/nitrite response regulator protein NarL [Paraburkholderia nemoris]CAE6807378.1 Nitrate/nitrite response regulator protein NarL [Paraburkholderia nemoris]